MRSDHPDRIRAAMKLPGWLRKMTPEEAIGASKHARGKRKPRGWRRSMRVARKRQRQARKARRRK